MSANPYISGFNFQGVDGKYIYHEKLMIPGQEAEPQLDFSKRGKK
jgi:hypothetical protein